MLSQDENPGVEFEYSLPSGTVKETPEGGERYEWQDNVSWSDCSAPCGGGTKTRSILCMSVASKDVMPPNLCDPQLKPLEHDNCNTDPCEVDLKAFFQASETCHVSSLHTHVRLL